MRNRKPITALLIVCVVAALALPAVASATYQAGDSPTVVLREGLGPSRASAPADTPAASVVVNHTSSTLPVVLAAVALGIALTGTAYVTVRLRSLSRA
jgi:hypothetical protein